MKRIIPILFLCLCGCCNIVNTKCVTVLDAETGQPIPNLEVVRFKEKWHYWISSAIEEKGKLTTNRDGVVPLLPDEHVKPVSGYTTNHPLCAEKQIFTGSSTLWVIKERKPNQQVDPILTTPVDKVEAQGTQGHP